MEAAQSAAEAHQRGLSRHVSAVVANLADPDAQAFGGVVIDEAEHGAYYALLAEARAWSAIVAAHQDECLNGVDPAPVDPSTLPATIEPASAGPCPPTLRAMNAVVDLGAAKLRVNCERIQLEGGVPVAPWMEAFGEVKYDPRAGNLTLIAGAKAKAGGGPVSAGFKSGLYLTVGAGGVQDVGWRVGPSLSASGGPAEFRVDDQMNLSFIGTMGSDERW
jgi:hypothetical protein